ncbi:MAG: FtsQ-type POTRA domain-containing protein, partial [Alicyclobacillus shizuokensis]|nr:FtsQ-type POTRA domain-containing protein [Alicyclobacillus shizuokensis]
MAEIPIIAIGSPIRTAGARSGPRGVHAGRKPLPRSRPLPAAIRHAIRLTALVLLVVTPVALAWMLLISPALMITEVQVIGNETVPAEQISQAAGLTGRSILALPVDQARSAVLAIPAVRTVTIQVEPLNRVTLTVTERQPWAIWENRGTRYVLDEEGVI